jgi:hypothetical protein
MTAANSGEENDRADILRDEALGESPLSLRTGRVARIPGIAQTLPSHGLLPENAPCARDRDSFPFLRIRGHGPTYPDRFIKQWLSPGECLLALSGTDSEHFSLSDFSIAPPNCQVIHFLRLRPKRRYYHLPHPGLMFRTPDELQISLGEIRCEAR